MQTNPAARRAAARRGGAPTPRLSTADDIRLEMARVYRAAKSGQIPPEVATRLVYILGEIRKAHELTVIEAQVAELERIYGERSGITSAPPRGHAALPARSAVDG